MNIEKTEKEVINELDELIQDVRSFRGAKEEEKIEENIKINKIVIPKNVEGKKIIKTVRQLKRKESHTFKVKLQINKRRYQLRVNYWHWNKYDEEAPTEESIRGDFWYLTNGTMKSIIKNHRENFLVKLKSYFDGMIDGTSFVKNPEFHKPSEKTLEGIIEDLGRKGLMSCHFNEDSGIFTAYSCCDNWEFALTDVNMKFL